MLSTWLYKPEAIEMSSKHLPPSFHTSYDCSYGHWNNQILSENHKPPPFETEAWFFAKIFIDPKLGTLPPTS